MHSLLRSGVGFVLLAVSPTTPAETLARLTPVPASRAAWAEATLGQEIERQMQQCLDRAETTDRWTACYARAEKAWARIMNEVWRKLRAQVPTEASPALREAQRRWLRFRDAEFAWLDECFVLRGSMELPRLYAYRVSFVRGRVFRLVRYTQAPPPPSKEPGREAYDGRLERLWQELWQSARRYDRAFDREWVPEWLRRGPPPSQRLREAQRRWQEFRDAELAWLDVLYADRDDLRRWEGARLIQERFEQLEFYHNIIKEFLDESS